MCVRATTINGETPPQVHGCLFPFLPTLSHHLTFKSFDDRRRIRLHRKHKSSNRQRKNKKIHPSCGHFLPQGKHVFSPIALCACVTWFRNFDKHPLVLELEGEDGDCYLAAEIHFRLRIFQFSQLRLLWIFHAELAAFENSWNVGRRYALNYDYKQQLNPHQNRA